MRPNNFLEGTVPPEAGMRARAYLRTAGQLDSCGTGTLTFGQMESPVALREFLRPSEFTGTVKNLFLFLRSTPREPDTIFERETAQTFSPIFRSPQFQSSDFTMAYNMAQATRLDVNLARQLIRKDHPLEPSQTKLPGYRSRVHQRRRCSLGLGHLVPVQAPGPSSDPLSREPKSLPHS